MTLWAASLVAVGLAMDAFAVSIACGLAVPRLTFRHVFRAAFHFGLFQAGMPVLGWVAGRTVAEHVAAWDHWVAFGLLSFIGGKMLWEARKKEAAECVETDPTRGWSLVTLSVATSIDALAVGLSLAMLHVSVWVPAAIIGVITAAISTLGISFGHRLGRRWGRLAELVGGLVLVGIGVRIVVAHLLGEAAPTVG